MADANLVLIVDDNFQNRELLLEILNQNGYVAAEAASGQAALDFVRQQAPDLILLDVRMPEMDGFETCLQLQRAGFDSIPIIFMTAMSDSASIQRAFEVGASDYISQPVRQVELLARLEIQFQKQILLETLWKQNENLENTLHHIQGKANQDAERLQMALQATGLGIWEWNILEDSIYWSPETKKLFGFKPDAANISYQTYLRLIPEEDRNPLMQAVADVLATAQSVYQIEHRLRRPDGEIVWIRAEGQVIRDEEGKPIRILGTIFDNTRHKLEDMVLLESQAILQEQAETLMAINQIANTLYQPLNIYELAVKAIDACCTFMGADSGAFYVLEGEMLRRIETLNVPDDLRAMGGDLDLNNSFTGAMVKAGKMFVSDDIGEDNRYVPGIQNYLVEMGIKRLISIPISHNEQILGALNIGFKERSPMEGDTRTTLETMGKTIGLALANVYSLQRLRSEIEEREKAERLQKVLYEISRATSRTGSLAELLAEVRSQLSQLLDSENFYVALYDEQKEAYSFPYWQDQLNTDAKIWETRPLKNSRPDYVRLKGEGCIIGEAMHKAMIAQGIFGQPVAPSISWMGVPLRTSHKVMGVMAVQSYTNPNAYHPADLEVMTYVAENIAWVIENKHIEEALRNSEEIFSKAFHASPDSVAVAEVESGKIIQVNQGFERIYGFSSEEAIGKSPVELGIYVYAEDRARMLEILQREGRVQDLEIVARNKKGEFIYCLMSVEQTVVKGIPCVVSIAKDITERKAAQEALRSSEATAREFQEKLRELLEISMELARYDELSELARQAVILGRERLGYDRLGLFMIDMEKDSIQGVFGTDENGKLRDERDIIHRVSADSATMFVLQSGKKSHIWENVELTDSWKAVGRGWNGMALIWDGDKSIGAIAADNLLSRQAVRPYEQELLGLYGTVLGYVISGKRVEAARQHVLERLQIINRVEQAILAAASPRAIANVVVERLQGFLHCDYVSVFSIDEESQVMHMLAWSENTPLLPSFPMFQASLLDIDALQKGRISSYADIRMERLESQPEKGLLDMGIRSFAIIPLLVDNALVGTLNLGMNEINAFSEEQIAIAQEIATQLSVAVRQARLLEQVQAYASDLETLVKVRTEQLEAKASELEAFTYSVSHDLRSPLRAMSGFADVLMEDYSSELSEDAHHYLERIRHNAQRMGALIDDLLALSRVGRRELSRKDFDMKAVVEEILAELEADGQIGKTEIRVEALGNAQADPVLMKQLWLNLITNAIKYSKKREQPEVLIGSRQENGETVYYIQDNGVGFDMQYAEKLFGVFQRLHSNSDYEGTGIGLATVHRIIERHNGRIWARAGVDKGASFYFVLGKFQL